MLQDWPPWPKVYISSLWKIVNQFWTEPSDWFRFGITGRFLNSLNSRKIYSQPPGYSLVTNLGFPFIRLPALAAIATLLLRHAWALSARSSGFCDLLSMRFTANSLTVYIVFCFPALFLLQNSSLLLSSHRLFNSRPWPSPLRCEPESDCIGRNLKFPENLRFVGSWPQRISHHSHVEDTKTGPHWPRSLSADVLAKKYHAAAPFAAHT